MDMKREVKLRCPMCGDREFLVTVEPSFDGRPMTPNEDQWLAEAVCCPACGETCEVQEI